MAPEVVIQTSDQIHLWRTLREISGVANPHVESSTAALRSELDAQQRALLEDLQQEMEQNLAHRERD